MIFEGLVEALLLLALFDGAVIAPSLLINNYACISISKMQMIFDGSYLGQLNIIAKMSFKTHLVQG